ncbi:MAG: signal transduction histidine kinase, partial [Crocinitomicaceae bacterium]
KLSSDLKKLDDGFMTYYQQRQERLDNLKDAFIQVSFKLIKDEEIILRMKMSDTGNGFDTTKVKLSSNDDTFGRGIGLIYRVCKRVNYSDNGSTIEVDFPITKTVSID